MKLHIDFDVTNYRSDSFSNGHHGRIVKKFFKKLSTNVFENSQRYAQKHFDITGESENPLLHGERNLYSLFATSINNITPVHLSEWGFSNNENETLERSRRVDYWCLYKEKNLSKPLNFYLELKTGWYSLNKRSNIKLDKRVYSSIDSLTKQLRDLKKLRPNFSEIDDIYLGIFIIYGYYKENEEHYSSSDLHDEFYKHMDKRTIKYHLIATWTLPDDVPTQLTKNKCRFISIIGFPL